MCKRLLVLLGVLCVLLTSCTLRSGGDLATYILQPPSLPSAEIIEVDGNLGMWIDTKDTMRIELWYQNLCFSLFILGSECQQKSLYPLAMPQNYTPQLPQLSQLASPLPQQLQTTLSQERIVP